MVACKCPCGHFTQFLFASIFARELRSKLVQTRPLVLSVSLIVSHEPPPTPLSLDLPADEMGNVFTPKAVSLRTKFTDI